MAQGHISFWKQLTRGLLGMISAGGFGCLWYALFTGIEQNLWVFLGGVGGVLMGALHLVIAVRKQVRYHRRDW